MPLPEERGNLTLRLGDEFRRGLQEQLIAERTRTPRENTLPCPCGGRARYHLTRERVLNMRFEHLTFPSGYEPHAGEPGRERWLSYEANRTAHAWVVRSRQPGRRTARGARDVRQKPALPISGRGA